MLKKIWRALLGVLLVSLMIATLIFIAKKNNSTSKSSGTITVIVNSIDDGVKDKKRISYNKGDTLFEVLEKEYDLTFNITSYGHYITGISNDSFSINTDGKQTFIWFELAYLKDGKRYKEEIDFSDYEKQGVSTGIDGIALKDNMIFGINERDSQHETSIFNQSIAFNNEKKTSNFVFRILVYSISIAFVVGIIIYLLVVRNTNSKITIRELCILAFMTVILFVQEELLSVLPNIQLTFLLLAVYVKVFGFRKTTMIVLAHVLLDNIIMGSLTPIVMIPMVLGYMIYIGLIYLVRNKSIIFISLIGIIGSLIYCYLFLITNAVFLDIDVFYYWIADIPFEIMLVLSTVFTLIYLYNPLSDKLLKLWNNSKEELDLINEEKEEL